MKIKGLYLISTISNQDEVNLTEIQPQKIGGGLNEIPAKYLDMTNYTLVYDGRSYEDKTYILSWVHNDDVVEGHTDPTDPTNASYYFDNKIPTFRLVISDGSATFASDGIDTTKWDGSDIPLTESEFMDDYITAMTFSYGWSNYGLREFPDFKVDNASIIDYGYTISSDENVTTTDAVNGQIAVGNVKTKEEIIPFTTKYVADDTLESGSTIEVQAGVNGSTVTKETYEVNTTDGSLSAQPISTDVTTNDAQERIVKVGTKPTVTETEIPFETITKENLESPTGAETVVTEGVIGKTQTTITYTLNTETGEVTANEPTTEVLVEKVDKVVEIGTGENEVIPFETVYEDDPTLPKGEEKEVIPGIDGEKDVTGKILKEPQTRVVKRGTKEVVAEEPKQETPTVEEPKAEVPTVEKPKTTTPSNNVSTPTPTTTQTTPKAVSTPKTSANVDAGVIGAISTSLISGLSLLGLKKRRKDK